MAGLPALLGTIFIAPVLAGLRRQEPLSPALSPEDHDKFFDHDYPDDGRPKATKAFNFQHPFPHVQDSEDYDKDFVKDENSDGGEWKAQSVYDALRTKMQGSDAALEAAKATELSEQKKLEELMAKQKALEAAVDDAAKRAADADAAKEDAADALKGVGMDGAVAEVNKESTSLEDCKQRLAEAREKLRKQMAERDEALKNLPKSDKSAKEVEDEVARLEREVDFAASRLRMYRHSSVDSDGGVYYMTTPSPKAPAPAPAAPDQKPPPAPKPSGARVAASAGFLPIGLAVLTLLLAR